MLDSGRFVDAVNDFQQVLTEQLDRTFRSIDPSIAGYKARHSLALAYQNLQQNDEAAHEWLLAIDDCPQFSIGWLCLVRHYVNCARVDAACKLAETMRATLGNTSDCAIAASLCHSSQGQIPAAERILTAAFEATGDAACLDELARILVESGAASDSIPVLRQLREIQPDNSAVLHNLGIAHLLAGNTIEGREFLRQCLQVEPDRISTLCQFATACKDTSDEAYARELLSRSLAKHPDQPDLIEAMHLFAADAP